LGVAGAAVLAPSAQAAPIEYTSQCQNQTLPTLPIDPSQTKVEISVEPVKPTYKVGEVITIHWKWLAYSNVPLNTPLVTKVDKDSTLPKGKIALTGPDSLVEMDVEGERINPETPLGQPLIITDMKGQHTLTKAGAIDLTPKQYSTFTIAFGYDSETRCLPTTPVPVGTSITVEPGEVELPVLDAPEAAYVGAVVPLTGSRFTPGATPKASLCNADGTSCDETKFWTNTLAIDGQGNLTGTATLYPFGIADGPYVVRVSDGVMDATDTMTITTYVHGEATLTADKASGPIGTVVHLTGTEWRANYDALIVAVNAAGEWIDAPISAMSAADGKLVADYTIGAPGAVGINASNGEQSVTVPFTVTEGGTLDQSITAAVNPGSLSMTQAGTGIDLGAITLNGQEQTMTGALNQVTVVDARAGNLGWQLTGAVSDLTSDNGTIPAANVSWTPACVAGEGSPSTVTAGTAGPITGGATLCSQAPDAAAPTGGRFTADAEINLTTPAFVAPGSYAGTLTLTLA